MRKIPSIFVRGADGKLTDTPSPSCDWVFRGEGIATRKWDGIPCLVRDGKLYTRREQAFDFTAPPDWILAGVVGPDSEVLEMGKPKSTWWVPVTDAPEFRWHNEAWRRQAPMDDGTYELIGPKVNGGNDGRGPLHGLVRHGFESLPGMPDMSKEFLRGVFSSLHWEGLVFHHPDGRMAKIKARDLGLPWGKKS